MQVEDCEVGNSNSKLVTSFKFIDASKVVQFCKAWDVSKLSPAFDSDKIDIEQLKSSIGQYYTVKLQKTVKNNSNGDTIVYMNILNLKEAK